MQAQFSIVLVVVMIIICDYREELYKECAGALQVGSLLSGGDFAAIKEALIKAFESVDQNLLKWWD